MTSESKILTVSYGTFSCTLEGFDNPFDTMKAIAEYFRDLAAQDRHFGAEPPPPDAAMLHRLAEREVSRLAASKADDSARLHAPAEAAVAEGPVAPRIQINPVNRRPAHPPVEPAAPAEDDVSAPEPSLQDVIPDGVAAKLARIRRSVSPAVPEAAASFTRFAADPDLQGEDLSPPLPEVAEAVPDDADLGIAAAEVQADAPAEEPTPAEAADSVAARLGALIASDVTTAYDEEEPAVAPAADWAEETIAEEAAPFVEVEADFVAEAELPEAVAVELTSPEDLDLASQEDDLALLAELDGIAQDEARIAALPDDVLPEDLPVEIDLAEAMQQDPLPEAVAADMSVDALPEASEAVAEPVAAAEVLAEATEALAEVEVPAEAAVEPEAEPVAEPEEPAPPVSKAGSRARRVNSRVVRIHPDDAALDPEGNIDLGATRVLASANESDEISRLMQQAEEVMAEDENRRRHEALSRLKAAVAATEADRADLDYEAPKVEANLDPYRDDLAEAIQPDNMPEPPAAPEVKPRRKSMTIRPAAEPRPGTIRPGMISPPPLVLVSEQRIDRVPSPGAAPAPVPAAAPSKAPVMPGISPSLPEGQPMVALRTGRLSGAIGAGAAVAASGMPVRNVVLDKPSFGIATEAEEDEELAEDSKEIDERGFASFAETVGAKSMAEMLEAAAAYATCVENRSQFTRPQLMRRMMASAGTKTVSREDGLRSFGTLLRTGRIEKVTRGHYSLADTSPYLAEARRLS
ncbi:hypothetical protein [Tabrizicola sp.]|uniref:hypothetical protein n=1 Tax=Tabrizicola sp. TaxID=2005166 RepID=UPI001A52096D|nr:hypothetical protein [Tabrizicola sp.]MBL9064555.1 hypothetical protein [Tabrizicola sp.]